MSGAKVIFTYKRKRLSSCSSHAHVDVYNDLLDEAKASKHPDLMKEYTSENKKEDPGDLRCVICGHLDNLLNCKSCCQSYHPQCLEACNKHVCCGKQLSPLSDQTDEPISQAEKHVEGSTSNTLGTHVLPQSKVSLNNTSAVLGEDIHSSLALEKGECCIHKDASSQLMERGKSKLLGCDDFVKPKLTSPLITFSRRLKRKADAEKTDVLSKLLSEREIVEGRNICVSARDTSGKGGTSANQSGHQKPVSDVTDASLMPSKTGGRVAGELDDCSPCNLLGTRSATVALKHVGQTTCVEDLNLVSLSSDEHVFPKIQEPNASASSEEAGTRNALQESVRCSPSGPVVVSSCTDNSKTCPGPSASTGVILPITSSNGSEPKDLPRVKEEQADACVIDCNVALEPESPELAVVEVVENHQLSNQTTGSNIVTRDESRRGEVLDLYMTAGQRIGLTQLSGNSQFPKHPSKSIDLDGSRLDYGSEFACRVPATEIAPKSKYLQLFSEDSTRTYLASSQLETIGSSWERGRPFALGAEKNRLEQSSVKVPLSLGLSAQSFGGQSSNHCSTVHPFASLNIRTGDYFHTDGGHSLRDHTSILRRKMLLDSVNSRATAMRGRGSSMDMFELCPNVWTEDELDFLWIGVRRHGRGNWDVMLRDPRLHFSPLRMPRDLADRWELEQYKLLNESGVSQGRYAKPPASYGYPDCNDPFLSSRPGILRDCAMAETQLSLGDVYRQKEAGFYNCNAQSCNRTRKPHRLGRASSKRLSSSIKMGINNHSLLGESNVRSVNLPSMGAAAKKVMPHWLQDAANSSTLLAASISLAGTSSRFQNFPEPSAMPGSFMTGELQASTSAQHGDCFVLGDMNTCPGNKSNNLIVIDSDVSSEETISDEHNARP